LQKINHTGEGEKHYLQNILLRASLAVIPVSFSVSIKKKEDRQKEGERNLTPRIPNVIRELQLGSPTVFIPIKIIKSI